MKNILRQTGMLASLASFLIVSNSHAAANASFEDTHFSGSGVCVDCHDGLTDTQGNDISIIKNWSTSMMANSTRDPYWRAKVASELHRNPGLSDEINDKCSRCHAPMANDSAKKDGAPLEILGSGFLNPINTYYDHALDGVSCTVCHQIADDGNLGTLDGVSGKYTILQYANAVDRPAFGQYLDPATRQMQNNVQFTPQHGAHTSTSEMCATCHDLKTPFVDAAGELASTTPESEFPEQMVYSEWKNSAYQTGGSEERSCQSCHMPKVSGDVKISTRPQNLAARPGFSRHTFLGANTTMLDILDNNRDALEVTATGFDQTILDTRALLQSAATIDVLSREMIGNQLKVVLKITNHTGHKLPSSYPSRRAYIHFLVQDDNGSIVFESGKLNANGSIAGVGEDIDASTYEPHYDQITAEDQVQVYGPIMQNTDGNVTHTLLRAAAYKKDNRLTPAGFDKGSVPSDVAVVGAASTDTNFNLGTDTITYLINVGNKRGFTINASLNYQTLSYGHLQDLFKDSASVAEVADFETMFDNANIREENLTSTADTLPFVCDMTLTLLKNQWNQIAIPCQLPAASNSVNAVLGDDITGIYGQDWAVFEYNPASNAYLQLSEGDSLQQGKGYWIVQLSSDSVVVDLPTESTLPALTTSTQCSSSSGCFEVAVAALDSATTWNMLGSPYVGDTSIDIFRLKTASGVCADSDACTLTEAAAEALFHDQVWHYDPAIEDYVLIEGAAAMNPWAGFWAASLSNATGVTPVLLLPVD